MVPAHRNVVAACDTNLADLARARGGFAEARADIGVRVGVGGVAIASPIRDPLTAHLRPVRGRRGITAIRQESTVDVSPHPEFDRILEAMRACHGVAWGGIGYRSVVPRYATNPELINGVGSRTFGARWNTKGEFRAVYASLDEMTAMLESTSHNRHYGIPVHQAFPRVFAAIEFQLGSVLMLNDIGVLSSLGLTAAQLVREPWRELQDRGQEALTQAVGRAAWTLRFEGLMVTSSENPVGLNLVVFNDVVPFDRMKFLGS